MMSLKIKSAVALISIASFLTGGAKAMTIDEFGRLNNDDEAGYVAFLVEASAQMLKSHGQTDQANKIIPFFKEPGKDGGVHQLASNLKMINSLNKRNAINPNNRAPVYLVEDAMADTLKEIGITIPVTYLLASGKDFRPSGPPRQHAPGQ